MERANQAIRRSSVKLKCLGSGHSDLNMIISDVNEMKSAFKSFHLVQITTWEDMAKWAHKEKTIALQEIFHVLLDLCYLWSEVQLDFMAGLKKFKHQFELILESEVLLDKSKSHLLSCEQKDNKIKKEIKKATAKGNIDDAKRLSERQVETQAHVKVAMAEVKSKTLENEAAKLMLVKEGLLNISSCYLELVDKGSLIFRAHKEVARSLPDVLNRDIEEIRYPGTEVARNIVIKTKESVHCYKKSSEVESAPPPYTRAPVFQSHNNSECNAGHLYPHQFSSSTQEIPESTEYPSNSNNLGSLQYNSRYTNNLGNTSNPPHYDFPPEDCLEGAVGGKLVNDTSSKRYANIYY